LIWKRNNLLLASAGQRAAPALQQQIADTNVTVVTLRQAFDQFDVL